MKICRNCQTEIVKVEAQKTRRFYCSHTCYERFTSRVKYYRHHEKQLERSKERNNNFIHKEKLKECDKINRIWLKENGLSFADSRAYGITFLKSNPEIVEILRISKEIKKTKMSDKERRENKRQYYLENRDKFLQKAKEYREKKIKN